MNDVLVIGGGAAGLMSALFAARAGASVTLLEKNEKLGKKIYITGKGRCNLTNTAAEDQFLANVMRNPRFLYASLSALSNRDVMALFEALGVPLADTVAFGDSMNDWEMMHTAGISVCMADGSPELRRACSRICPPVEQDGLATAFAELGLI